MITASAILAFLLEMAVYAAAGHWAYTRARARNRPLLLRLALAAAAVTVLAAVWGCFGAPSASLPLHGAGRAALELCWFGSGMAALAAAKGRRPALVFAAVWLLSTLLHLAHL